MTVAKCIFTPNIFFSLLFFFVSIQFFFYLITAQLAESREVWLENDGINNVTLYEIKHVRTIASTRSFSLCIHNVFFSCRNNESAGEFCENCVLENMNMKNEWKSVAINARECVTNAKSHTVLSICK